MMSSVKPNEAYVDGGVCVCVCVGGGGYSDIFLHT